MKALRIALDYDDTFTEDREGWSLFVHMMRNRGHDITFVTYRQGPNYNAHTDNTDILTDAETLGIDVVFTCHKQKAHIVKADVWIDDAPERIVSLDQAEATVQMCRMYNDTGSL